MKKYSLAIIEDEEPARMLIKKYISERNDIEIIAECDDGFAGVKAINELKPDITILDIQMPKLTGLELIELIEHKPAIIFSTAYDNYAINAFEKNAIDYILKPYSKARLLQAVDKAIENINLKTSQESIERFVANDEAKNEPLQRIAIRNNAKLIVLPIEQVDLISADGDYVKVHSGDAVYLKEKTMRYFENNLPPSEFVRIHRSCIVNINKISKIEPFDKDSHVVVLKSGKQIKTSATGYKNLKLSLGL